MLLLETSHQDRACVPYDVFTFVCMSGLGQRRAVLRTGDLVLLLGEKPKTEHASQSIVHNHHDFQVSTIQRETQVVSVEQALCGEVWLGESG